MKIAVVTDDGKTISQHFGRARYFSVVKLENGEIITKELREKAGHHSFAYHGQGAGGRHGFEPGSYDKHVSMAQAIEDCQVVIAGGMGYGAYEFLRSTGKEVIATDAMAIDDAIELYLKGKLVNRMERLD